MTVVISSMVGVTAILIRHFENRRIPYNIIITVTMFALYLVKFAQARPIQEFFWHKLAQNTLNFKETFLVIKSRLLNIRKNKVGIQ